jgi:hypothetical protein
MIRGIQVTIPFFAYNPVTFAPATGLLDLTAVISKDGATPASATNTPAEIDAITLPGWYRVTLTTTETDCVMMILKVTSATATVDPVILDFSPADYAKTTNIPTVQSIQTGLATDTDVQQILALLGYWAISLDTLTTTTTDGTETTYTVTRNARGQITAIAPASIDTDDATEET